MPPVLGPVSPSPTRLWSCAVASGSACVPSISAKKLASSPAKNSSTTTSAPAHEGLRLGGVAEAAIGGGRDAVSGAEILGEALGALERGGRFCRTEGADISRFEPVDQPGDQRRLRPDHDEVDPLAPGEGENSLDIRRRDRDAGRLLGDAGIAGRAEERVAQRRGGDRPAQRMLAPARPDHQYPHPVLLEGRSQIRSPVPLLLYQECRLPPKTLFAAAGDCGDGAAVAPYWCSGWSGAVA